MNHFRIEFNGDIMKKLIIINILFIVVLSFYIFTRKKETLYIQSVSYTTNNEQKIEIKNDNNTKILVYYPNTKYILLNETIFKKINEYITNFQKEIASLNVQSNQYYYLIITYESYKSYKFISYAFNIEYYTGGAHPNHDIWTINYDKFNNKLVGINELIKINSNVLNLFSSISRKELTNNKKIVDTTMMLDGTQPKDENFSKFVFSNDKIIIFFLHYQVAPYSSGQFMIEIPIKEINKNK